MATSTVRQQWTHSSSEANSSGSSELLLLPNYSIKLTAPQQNWLNRALAGRSVQASRMFALSCSGNLISSTERAEIPRVAQHPAKIPRTRKELDQYLDKLETIRILLRSLLHKGKSLPQATIVGDTIRSKLDKYPDLRARLKRIEEGIDDLYEREEIKRLRDAGRTVKQETVSSRPNRSYSIGEHVTTFTISAPVKLPDTTPSGTQGLWSRAYKQPLRWLGRLGGRFLGGTQAQAQAQPVNESCTRMRSAQTPEKRVNTSSSTSDLVSQGATRRAPRDRPTQGLAIASCALSTTPSDSSPRDPNGDAPRRLVLRLGKRSRSDESEEHSEGEQQQSENGTREAIKLNSDAIPRKRRKKIQSPSKRTNEEKSSPSKSVG